MPAIRIVNTNPLRCIGFMVLLERAGYLVSTATHTVVLLRQATPNPPDLVLITSDRMDADGLSAVRNLRADPRTATVPIIVQSTAAAHAPAAHAAGATAFLVMPGNGEHLLATIQELLPAATDAD